MNTSQSLPDYAVELTGLEKTYKGEGPNPPKQALKGIDMKIPRGCLFGLLGPNGAGKSTMINILAGLVIKTGGKASIWDTDIDDNPRQARAAIGVVPQELNIDPFFTPREMLDIQAGLYGVPRDERRTQELLDLVALGDKAEIYPRSLSGGMRRRLMVAKAMVHNPPVLVLDEPTAGVDIELRHSLWENVRALNARGTTVLLTTHYLEEAEELCDEIAIINHGAVVACDKTQDLIHRLDSKALRIRLDRDIKSVPRGLDGFQAELEDERHLLIHYAPSTTEVGRILTAVTDSGAAIADLTTEESDLEDLFLQLTSRSLLGDAESGETEPVTEKIA